MVKNSFVIEATFNIYNFNIIEKNTFFFSFFQQNLYTFLSIYIYVLLLNVSIKHGF